MPAIRMSNYSIAEGVRHAIYSHTYDVFEMMDFNYTADDIVIDYSTANTEYLEAIFYIKTVENVKRKIWYEVIDFILEGRDDIRIDLLRKKADQNIHFHLKYTKDPINRPVYEPQTTNKLLRRKP